MARKTYSTPKKAGKWQSNLEHQLIHSFWTHGFVVGFEMGFGGIYDLNISVSLKDGRQSTLIHQAFDGQHQSLDEKIFGNGNFNLKTCGMITCNKPGPLKRSLGFKYHPIGGCWKSKPVFGNGMVSENRLGIREESP